MGNDDGATGLIIDGATVRVEGTLTNSGEAFWRGGTINALGGRTVNTGLFEISGEASHELRGLFENQPGTVSLKASVAKLNEQARFENGRFGVVEADRPGGTIIFEPAFRNRHAVEVMEGPNQRSRGFELCR